MEVVIEGMQQMFNGLDRYTEEVLQTASVGLQEVGMKIIADAKDNLRRNGSVATARLIGTGKVQKLRDWSVDAGFMSGGENYAGAVEYGRRAGKMPPVQFIRAWLKKKHSKGIEASAVFAGRAAAERELNSLAFLIARAIGRHGSKPHPFFAPAVKRHEQDAVWYIERAVKQVTAKYSA